MIYLLNKLLVCSLCNLASRCDHMTPILETLHWLPVCYLIEYKV